MPRVPVQPRLLTWARERGGVSAAKLKQRFPKYCQWEKGEVQPTLKQLEAFAKVVHVPVGYLFLSEPPDEPFPIPDFRTKDGTAPRKPSVDLLDTIYMCQRRQDWYREFALFEGFDPLPFIGSASPTCDVKKVAEEIRTALRLNLEERRNLPTWTDALRHLIQMADSLGVLVMVSGIVGNNTHRVLDPVEFRGFALSDDLAPLVFINGSDAKAAQMFTLAHELAHLWLGQSAVSDPGIRNLPSHSIELRCNQIAAELLVPLHELNIEFRRGEKLSSELTRLARQFKVSKLVILRRLSDAGELTSTQFRDTFETELSMQNSRLQNRSGGDFYRTQTARLGRRFATAMVSSTLEGRTLYRDAYYLMGISKSATFERLAESMVPH